MREAPAVLMDDQDIIACLLRRESEAVRLIEGWITRAASPFRQRLGMHWEDVVQEITLEISRLIASESFRGESSLKTYVWRVTSHACINQLRKQQRHPTTDLDSISEMAGAPENSPLHQLMEKESQQILLQVLAEMSPECRGLWSMIIEGMSYQQISQQLGASEGALRVKVLRCRQKAVVVREQILNKKFQSRM